jgi:hypothetical protein
MRLREPDSTWVVYERHAGGKPKMTVLCDQSEWDAMDPVELGRCVLIRAGITNEGEAERLARTGAVVVKEKVASPKPLRPVAVADSEPGPGLRHVAVNRLWAQGYNPSATENPANAPGVGG